MKVNYVFVIVLLFSLSVKAQYSFKGHVDPERWQNNVYLSLIEDYRKLSGVFSEQIISKHGLDSLGYFKFSGNQLDTENRIYRIHVDNCKDTEQAQNHFEGRCDGRQVYWLIVSRVWRTAKKTDLVDQEHS